MLYFLISEKKGKKLKYNEKLKKKKFIYDG